HQGDDLAQEILLERYKYFVRSRARSYFLIGADKEDIIQEGMIGLYKAIRDYRDNKNASFKSFAELCINRQLITAIKAAGRQKHMPLNSSVSLNKAVYEEEGEGTYINMIESAEAVTSPEMIFIGIENRNFIVENIMAALSSFEKRVLNLYLQGKTYSEIALIMGKAEKSIDNALQRVKKKTEKLMEKSRLDD
ncbi:MAG: RNA polymerase sporulation sigma factor SigH, partial [Firmicutes bacterium]|nr:RNA polymerase sporulation sigma factor SigH [Bacillota bacterium]